MPQPRLICEKCHQVFNADDAEYDGNYNPRCPHCWEGLTPQDYRHQRPCGNPWCERCYGENPQVAGDGNYNP